jgi:hypothetical protein
MLPAATTSAYAEGGGSDDTYDYVFLNSTETSALAPVDPAFDFKHWGGMNSIMAANSAFNTLVSEFTKGAKAIKIYVPYLDVYVPATQAQVTAFLDNATEEKNNANKGVWTEKKSVVGVGAPVDDPEAENVYLKNSNRKEKETILKSDKIGWQVTTAKVGNFGDENYVAEVGKYYEKTSVLADAYVHLEDYSQPPHAKQYVTTKNTEGKYVAADTVATFDNPGTLLGGSIMEQSKETDKDGKEVKDKDGKPVYAGNLNDPLIFSLEDKDPGAAYKLALGIHYSVAYGKIVEDYMGAFQEMQKDPDFTSAYGPMIDFGLNMVDAFYPLIAPDVKALNIDGDLDQTALDMLAPIINYVNMFGQLEEINIVDPNVPQDIIDLIEGQNTNTIITISDTVYVTSLSPEQLAAAKASVNSVGTAVKTIYVQKGKTVKIPYVVYAKKGASKNAVKGTWKASNVKVASLDKKLKAKAGVLTTKKLDAKSVLTVTAGKKLGTSKITVSIGGKNVVYNIKVVKKAAKVKKFAATNVKSLKKGKTKVIKISKFTKNGTGNVATFTINKKYKKYLKVDAAGKVTALKAYKKGKTAIPVVVKVGTKSKTIKVKVK